MQYLQYTMIFFYLNNAILLGNAYINSSRMISDNQEIIYIVIHHATSREDIRKIGSHYILYFISLYFRRSISDTYIY